MNHICIDRPDCAPSNGAFSAFGSGGAEGQPGYNGGESTAALVYMRNRWYDPNTGRFTQEGPIGYAGGINLYAYAGGDPVTYSDPWGLCAAPPDSILITVEVFCPNPDETGSRSVWAHRASAAGIASLVGMAQSLTGGNETYTPENVKADYAQLQGLGSVYTFPTKSADGLAFKELAHGDMSGDVSLAFRSDVWGGILAGKSGAVFGGKSVCTIVGHEGVHLQQSQGVGVRPGMSNKDYEDIAYNVPWSCE